MAVRSPRRRDVIRREHSEGVTTLCLDRAERRNALTGAMIAELREQLDEARADADCFCVVITGSGGNFCSGRDLGELPAADLTSVLAYDESYTAVFTTLAGLGKPSIAVVEGYAVAGGFSLAMGCDFVLATESAVFGALEMQRDFPAAINTALLSRLCPPRIALEWLMLGERIPAPRLYEVGLINRLAADADALQAARQALTASLRRRDPVAVRLARESLQAVSDMPLGEALRYGKTLNALLLSSGRIGMAADSLRKTTKTRD